MGAPNQIDKHLKAYLRAYEVEPVGKLLVDRLHLSAPVIGAIFAFLYFGMLLILPAYMDDRSPSSFREIFQHSLSLYC